MVPLLNYPKSISPGTRSNRTKFGHAGDVQLINCYPEELGADSKTPIGIYAIDGLTSWATLNDEGVRAMLALETALYVVSGRTIYEIDAAGNATSIGGVIGDGLVTMARNRASVPQIGVCADGIFKIIQGSAVTSVTDADLPPANSVCHVDGYFVLTIDDGRVFITALNDGTSIDGLDFAKAESNPDGLLRGARRGRDLVLFGPKSIEFYQNTGAADFPFTRITAIDIGCYAAGSVADVTLMRGGVSSTLAFVGSNVQGQYAGVMVLTGYSAQVISTHEVDRLIQGEANPDNITATSWTFGGHSFYALSGTDWTWVYDFATGLAHTRKSYNRDRWRVSASTQFNGKTYAGDSTLGAIYEVSSDAKDEAGESIIMTVQTPAVHAYPSRLKFHALYVDAIPGSGLNTADTHNSDPKLMVSYSDDGGHTFSTERHLSLGVQGQRRTRTVTRRLGQCGEDGRMFKLSTSADVCKGVMGMAVDVEEVAP